MWYVYILKCSDNSYYIGHTNNLTSRISEHNSKRAAKWTTSRLPAKLVYSELHKNERQAISRELTRKADKTLVSSQERSIDKL